MPGGPLKRLIGGDVLTNVSLGPKGWGMSFLWMSAALAAYGGMTAALQAVLLYRLIGYWAVLLTGAICYLPLWRRRSLVTPASGAVRYGRNDNSPRLLRSRLSAIQAATGRRGEREAA